MKLYYSSGTVIAAAVRLIYGGTGTVCVEQYCSTGGTGDGRGAVKENKGNQLFVTQIVRVSH